MPVSLPLVQFMLSNASQQYQPASKAMNVKRGSNIVFKSVCEHSLQWCDEL